MTDPHFYVELTVYCRHETIVYSTPAIETLIERKEGDHPTCTQHNANQHMTNILFLCTVYTWLTMLGASNNLCQLLHTHKNCTTELFVQGHTGVHAIYTNNTYIVSYATTCTHYKLCSFAKCGHAVLFNSKRMK